MKIILINRLDIKAKTGNFVKLGYINPVSGQVDNLFMRLEQFEAFQIPPERVCTAQQIGELDWPVEVSDADFDNRGQLVQLR